MKVLFVCTGNSCRSVLAEQLLRALAAKRGLRWQARSCGLAANPLFPVPGPVRALVEELGVRDFHHQPRPVSPELVAWADLVLAMTDSHMRELWRAYPEARAKTQLLRERAGLDSEDVEDPIGGDLQAYRDCLAGVGEAIERLLDEAKPRARKGTRGGRGEARTAPAAKTGKGRHVRRA